MNKYIIKAALAVALAAPLVTSCELDQYPRGSMTTEQSWQRVSDATNYNTGLLAVIRGVSGGAYTSISEIQGDLFNLLNKGTDFYAVYDWSFTNNQFDGDGVWSANYNLVANANNVLNNIDKIAVEEGSDDAALIKEYKGTAYFARAYALSNLVTKYCKNYDAATAANTPGLPLLTVSDVNDKPARASLKDTYAFIKSDIAKAKECFADDKDNDDVSRPTYNSALALEARVCLESQDYTAAVSSAEELIAKYPLISDAAEFADMWATDEGSEIIFEPQLTQDERPINYGVFIDYDESTGFIPQYIPTQGLMDLYEDSDIRKGAYFAQTGVSTGDQSDENAYIFAKFPGNDALKKDAGNATEFYNMAKVFRVSEMYLISAEAQYLMDGSDNGRLNALRAARGASQVTQTGDLFYDALKREWARELCGEGQRFDCLKRWNKGFTRMTPQNLETGMVKNTNNTISLTVEPTDYRFVWEIPMNDLQANANLVSNWGGK